MIEPTIQDIASGFCWLEIHCTDCDRTVHIPYGLLPERLPPDLPCNLAAAHFRCSKCKSKQLTSKLWDMQHAAGYATKLPAGKKSGK